MKILITLIALSALGLIHARPAHQSNSKQEEVRALLQNLMRSEGYQDTNVDEYTTDNHNNFNALSLGEESASNQFFGMALKAAVKRIFNRRFRNAIIRLFKPCLCREELIKEQQSDDDGDDDGGAELMQDDEPDSGMYAEAEGWQFKKMKKCVLKRLKRLPGLALKYAG